MRHTDELESSPNREHKVAANSPALSKLQIGSQVFGIIYSSYATAIAIAIARSPLPNLHLLRER